MQGVACWRLRVRRQLRLLSRARAGPEAGDHRQQGRRGAGRGASVRHWLRPRQLEVELRPLVEPGAELGGPVGERLAPEEPLAARGRRGPGERAPGVRGQRVAAPQLRQPPRLPRVLPAGRPPGARRGEGPAEQDGEAAQAAGPRGTAGRVQGLERGARGQGGGRGLGLQAVPGRSAPAAPCLPALGGGVAPEVPGALSDAAAPRSSGLSSLRRHARSPGARGGGGEEVQEHQP